jgi:3-hydroxyisobutyrate dehydrogenase-like beta-hydroxyacid dehydrogenase
MSRVGVLGLGVIGGGLVRSLANKRSDDIVVYDPRPEAMQAVAGIACGAASPCDAADGADVVFVAVYDDEQVRSALDGPEGVLRATRAPDVIVVVSTVSVATVDWAQAVASRHGSDILDCGVTGGGAIEEGTISALIGGNRDAYERACPVIEGFSVPLYFGPLGSGMKAKLARQLIVFGTWYACSEAARLAGAAGLDIAQLVEASDTGDVGTGGCTALLKWGIIPSEGPRDDDDRAMREMLLGFSQKDMGAALALAEELGVDLPGAQLVMKRFAEAVSLDPGSGL